jgi:hypothetical protein
MKHNAKVAFLRRGKYAALRRRDDYIVDEDLTAIGFFQTSH